MKKLTVLILALSVLFSLLCLASCDSDGGTETIKENERLTAQLTDLTKAYNALEAELSAIKDGKVLDDAKIAALEAELNDAKSNNLANTDKITALEADIYAAKEQKALDDAKIISISTELAAKEAKSEADAARISALEADIAAATEQKTLDDTKISGLEAELKAAKDKNTADTATIEGLEADLAAAKAQGAASTVKIEGLETELKAAKEQKALDDAKISSLESELTTAKSQNASDTAKIAKLETELASAKDKSEADAAEIKALEDDLAAARADSSAASAKIADLESELDAAREQKALDDAKISSLEAELKSAKDKNASDTAKISSLEAELSAAKAQSSEYAKSIRELEADLDTATAQKALDDAKISSLEAELKSAKDKNASDTAKISSLEAELSAAKAQNSEYAKSIRELEADLDTATAQKARDDAEIASLNAELTSAKNKSAADAAKISSLEADLKAANDQRAADSAKIAGLEAELTAAKNKNTDDAARIQELESTVAELERELDSFTVNVTFSTGDGASTVAPQRIINGGTATVPTAPKKSGYIFKGWMLNGAAFDFSTPINEDTTLTADWMNEKDLYDIKEIKIGEREISDYTLILDLAGTEAFNMDYINGFRAKLYNLSGYSMKADSCDNIASHKNKFLIRFVSDAGEDGYRAYATENDFIVECAYANAFDKSFTEMIDGLIFDKTGYIKIPADYSMTDHVSSVKYSDFGAKGNGKTEDFEAIYNTHIYANQCGQKVYGDEGATYYIWNFTKTIPIKTDTDFNGATFLINDKGDDVYTNRGKHLFTIAKEYSTVTLSSAEIKALFPNEELLTTDKSIKWLADAGYLPGEWNMVRLTNDHKDFIRHGANINSGNNRTDIVIADKNGNLHEDTPAIFDFKAEDQLINNGIQYQWYRVKDGKRHNFTKIEIFRVDDEPITVENGYFERSVCEVVAATDYKNKWVGYYRAFYINRSNATVKNLKHRLVDEPVIVGQGKDSEGNYRQSYPYYGFLFFTNSYNSTAIDCNLAGHTTYYEAKTTSSSPVPMGSYDLVIEYSSHINLKNVIQNDGDEVFLGDSHYWGIMSSNGSKNMNFEDCKLSRFDAHRGFWNSTLKNCVFGQYINVMGGGTFYLENVRKLVGANFMSMRGDYGASFRGDITMKNCTLEGLKTYNNSYTGAHLTSNLYVINSGFKSGTGDYKGHYSTGNASAFPYLKWDFGYTCYMPEHVVIDNFSLGAGCSAPVYLFNNIGNYAFEKPDDFITEGEEYHILQYTQTSTGTKFDVKTTIATEDIYYNQYQITKSITYRNMSPLRVCPSYTSSYYSRLAAIPTYLD